MPRQARVRTDNRLYHVMLRGINRQQMFLGPEDCAMFLEVLQECKALSGFSLYAYCLMGNHVHLLIRAEDEDISKAMKRIGIRFVQRFNRKYGRTGHLFQDRYKSQTVNDDGYFLNLIRYIHQNPVKAGLTALAADYPYSSYSAYSEQSKSQLVDIGLLYEMIGRNQFEELMLVPAAGTFLDIPERRTALSDQKAVSLIRRIARVQEAEEMLQLDPDAMDRAITLLLQKGISVRQLARLTGIPRGHADSVSRRKKQDYRQRTVP